MGTSFVDIFPCDDFWVILFICTLDIAKVGSFNKNNFKNFIKIILKKFCLWPTHSYGMVESLTEVHLSEHRPIVVSFNGIIGSLQLTVLVLRSIFEY